MTRNICLFLLILIILYFFTDSKVKNELFGKYKFLIIFGILFLFLTQQNVEGYDNPICDQIYEKVQEEVYSGSPSSSVQSLRDTVKGNIDTYFNTYCTSEANVCSDYGNLFSTEDGQPPQWSVFTDAMMYSQQGAMNRTGRTGAVLNYMDNILREIQSDDSICSDEQRPDPAAQQPDPAAKDCSAQTAPLQASIDDLTTQLSDLDNQDIIQSLRDQVGVLESEKAELDSEKAELISEKAELVSDVNRLEGLNDSRVVNCYGEWTPCNDICKKRYDIKIPASNNGKECQDDSGNIYTESMSDEERTVECHRGENENCKKCKYESFNWAISSECPKDGDKIVGLDPID